MKTYQPKPSSIHLHGGQGVGGVASVSGYRKLAASQGGLHVGGDRISRVLQKIVLKGQIISLHSHTPCCIGDGKINSSPTLDLENHYNFCLSKSDLMMFVHNAWTHHAHAHAHTHDEQPMPK